MLLNKNMVEEGNSKQTKDISLKAKFGIIDKKAFAGAVGIMAISWLGLPIVYWLIVKGQNNKKENNLEEEEKENGK